MNQLPLELTEGQRRRDDGMARALDHADREVPSWSVQAWGYLLEFLGSVTTNQQFMAEEVRHFAEKRGFELPPDRRAWGGVIVRASKRGMVRRIGYGKHEDPKSHHAPATLWVRVL